MALAETAKLVATLDLQGNFIKNVGNAQKSLGRLSTSIAKSRAVAVGLGVGLERAAEKGISALGGAIAQGIESAQELERVQQQTQAAIESTGGAAGVTAAQVRALAEATEDLTTVDDKNVQAGEDVLLRYTQIGKDIFPRATKAATDLAVALAKGDPEMADVAASAKIIGKALADPVKGLGALRKAGVVLGKDQEALVKHFVKTGKTAEAQKIILQELERRYGKAGEAASQGFGGDMRRARDAIEDAQISIAQGLMPALGEVAREMSTVLKDPAVKNGLRDLGVGIGAAIKGLVAFAKTVPWGSIANSLQAAAGFAKDLLNAFLGLPDWVKTAVITGWGLNKLTGGALSDIVGTLASGLIKGVLGITAGVVNVNGGVVNGPGGIPGKGVPNVPGGPGTIGTIAGIAAKGAVILAPASVAAIGLAVDQAVDPNDSLKAIATAETAMGRGIADWNNKGIATLQQIAANTGDKTAIEWLQTHGLMLDPSVLPQLVDTFDRRQPGFTEPELQDSFDRAIVPVRQAIEATNDSFDRAVVPTTNAVESADRSIGRLDQTTSTGTGIVQSQVMRSGAAGVAATNSGTSQIVGAINSIPAPITNIYVSGATVRRETVRNDRGGSSDDDRYRNGDPNGPGNPGR